MSPSRPAAKRPDSVLAIASVMILACAPAQYLGRQQDDLLYLIGAHSLLEGRFRLLTVPGQPPLYMIGPGFPALLAPLALAAGENWWVYQAFCALLLAAAPWLLWRWLRSRLDGISAMLVCGLFALSPLVLSQAGTVMSEGPFLIAALGLLLAVERPAPKTASAWLLLATQTRTAALALLPAAIARPLSKRRWKEAALVGAPALSGALAFSLWSRAVSGSAQQKLEELAASYAGGLGRLPSVAWENSSYYLSSWGASFMPVSWSAAAPAVGAGLLSIAILGAWKILRRDRWEPALWLLAGTALLHLAWPWHYERYLIMPLPFLLWCLAEGLGRAAKPALAALLLCQGVFQSPQWLGHRQAWTKPELAGTYAWIKTRTKPSDVLASVMYVRDGFLSARPALPLPPSPDARSLHETLSSRKVRYILWQDGLDLGLSLDSSSAVRIQLERDADGLKDASYFKPVHEEPGEQARLYELR
ncbi:MAG: hypothetical protein HY077_18045 [Elusimicrobia bacterium]|nr:hypothetical protein [Elusimicrobiota bacterium]